MTRQAQDHKVLRTFIANIPKRHIVKTGRLLGILMYFLDGPHRRLVRRNLQFCYPDRSRHQISELRKEVFKNAGITFLEIWQMACFSREQLLDAVKHLQGLEHLVNALKQNRGAVVFSAHLANWELGFIYFGCYLGRPLTGVARHLRLPRLDRWFYRLRTRFGNKIIFKKGALPEMRQILRNGEILALTLDQSRHKQAIEVMFFGHRATVTPAAAMLSMRCKSPVIPIFCSREPDGSLTIHIAPPLKMEKTGDLRADLRTNTQKMVDAMEAMIRRYPDQWIWFQRPWKKTYPQLYPEWAARRRKKHGSRVTH
jgi:Kdo2-lipid IVA lauroyltransferase/acyltransferase